MDWKTEYRKAYINEYTKRYVAQRRSSWIEEQGGKCNHCSATNVPYDIDHINPALKTMRAAQIWYKTKAVRDLELANCQVLCRSCHKAKTSSERTIHNAQHGTTVMYFTRSCRCDLCVEYGKEYRKASKARVKARQLTNG
jgi:5-methylcytosine-specific restriction endonuclease McrA